MRPGQGLPALLLALAGLGACADGVGVDAPSGVSVQFALQAPAAVSASETGALQVAFDQVDSYEVSVTDSISGAVIAADTLPAPTSATEHRFDFDIPADAVGLTVLVDVVAFAGGVELYRASQYTTIRAGAGSLVSIILTVRYTGPGVRGAVVDANGAGLGGVSVGLYQGGALVASVTTEPDGTYLFLNPGTGPYSVEPIPAPSVFVCPATRDLDVQVGSAVLADFSTSSSPCQIDLLILSGGDVDNTSTVASLFASTPGVTTDTFFYLNQTPGLSLLRQYDVVLLFNNGIFDETVAIGNQLTDYVELGGNLVIGSFYWQGRGDSQFATPGWGALESIDPFVADTIGPLQMGGATYTANDLGTIALRSHPLIQGVSTLVSISGFSAGVLAKAGTTVVASWTDGAPMVGYRVLPGGQRVVAVSLFPAATDPTQVRGDVQPLWENAIVWAGAAGGPIP